MRRCTRDGFGRHFSEQELLVGRLFLTGVFGMIAPQVGHRFCGGLALCSSSSMAGEEDRQFPLSEDRQFSLMSASSPRSSTHGSMSLLRHQEGAQPYR
jgi:hypothetical protein